MDERAFSHEVLQIDHAEPSPLDIEVPSSHAILASLRLPLRSVCALLLTLSSSAVEENKGNTTAIPASVSVERRDGNQEQEPRDLFQVVESSETQGRWWGIVKYDRIHYSGKRQLVLTPEKVRFSSRGDAGNSSLSDHTFAQPVEITFSLAEGNEGQAFLTHRNPEEFCREVTSLILPPLTNPAHCRQEWVMQPGAVFDVITMFRHPVHNKEQSLLGKRKVILTLGDHTVEISTDLRDMLPVRRILPGVPEDGFLVSPHLQENLRCVRCPVVPGSVIWIRFTCTPEVAKEEGMSTFVLRQCGKNGELIEETRGEISGANKWYDAVVHVEERATEIHCLFQSTLPSGSYVHYLTAEVLRTRRDGF